MSLLPSIKECLRCEIINSNRNYLLDHGTNIKVKIKSSGPYLLYNFDVNKDMFPFFQNVEGLKAIADYVLITENKGKLFALIIELKHKNGDPRNQIRATKEFTEYLLKSIYRVKRFTQEKPILRGLGYSKLIRPTTKVSRIYDHNHFAFISGTEISLDRYLL